MSEPDLRAVMTRFPHGVCVVTVATDGQRLGLTVSSLVSLSLDPPLVGIAVAREAAIHELLLDAGSFGVSLLAEGQESVAEHFARGVPPIAHWAGIDLDEAAGDPPLLAGAVGWARADVRWTAEAGSHTFVAGAVTWTSAGPAERALLRVRGGWGSA